MLVPSETVTSEQGDVSLLILGAGWTSTFLIPLLQRENVKYTATTTNGRNGTIPFKFDPNCHDTSQFAALPSAETVLITFPLVGEGQSAHLAKLYAATHKVRPHYIQLGVTSIWTASGWQDETSPYDSMHPRAVAEDELMASADAAVLSLAGLYGAARQPRHWVDRIIKTKEQLRVKGALHVIHGEDVARAILALHCQFTPGKRWILCDIHVYDWWDLVQDWALQITNAAASGDETVSAANVKRQSDMLAWVGELMVEQNVRALPRDMSSVGRRLDGRAFWNYMGIWPTQGRIR
ncbi:hypothetical protein GGS21DRAFT_530059 [Xylaria nigripes]|nr:hypothetical protein GGS21DRAFT_530059 [Xylaria nigripes]